VHDLKDLRWHMTDVWDGVDQSVSDDGIDHWGSRLHAYIRTTGDIL